MQRTRTLLLTLLLVICAQLILPPLSGMWSFGLLWIWLASIVIVFGVDTATVLGGVLGALIIELVSGMAMGSTAAGFVVAAVFYDVASRFVALRPLVHHDYREWTALIVTFIVGLLLVAVIASTAVTFEALLYGSNGVAWQQMMVSWYIPQVMLSIALQLIAIILLMRRIALFNTRRTL